MRKTCGPAVALVLELGRRRRPAATQLGPQLDQQLAGLGGQLGGQAVVVGRGCGVRASVALLLCQVGLPTLSRSDPLPIDPR